MPPILATFICAKSHKLKGEKFLTHRGQRWIRMAPFKNAQEVWKYPYHPYRIYNNYLNTETK